MIDKLKQSIRYAIMTLPKSSAQAAKISDGFVASFLKDDRGEHATEFLMILTFGVLPLIGAVFLLEDILQEFVAFGQIFVSSPFF